MSGRNEKISPTRLSVVQSAIVLIFLVLSFGLWRLQISNSEEYVSRAQQNRIRTVPVLAPRGKIYDREGRIIVDNYPSFSALLLRDQMRDLNADAPKIAAGLHISAEEIRDKVRRYQLAKAPTFQPIIIKGDITPDEHAFIESHRDELPELETIMVYRRLYPKDGFMAHLIGYTGEISEDMLNSPKYEMYDRGDIVGQSGVEQYYNDLLMGKKGSRNVVVDSKGREVVDEKAKNKKKSGAHVPDGEPAVPGQALRLTIDLDIQIAAEEALEGWKGGGIVALDPRSGEVLAMVSRPAFNPNDFAVRISREEWSKLINDPDHPLLNRVTQAQLAPGSVFKIIMSVAGLQEGNAANMRVYCTGGANFYGHFHACHGKHGVTDISKAITQSCDTFFYTLADRMGIEKIAKWATFLGIGKKTGVDLPNEASGTMPSEAWKIKNYHQKWYAGETVSVGVGQGAVAASPIQLARTIGGITMGGIFYRPHLVAPDQLPADYRKVSVADASDPVRVSIASQNWTLITDAMMGVLAPGGTASSAHLQGVDFAGKTGTAQVVSHAFREGKGKLGAEYNDNVWFVGVSPRRNPEIVVAVLLEHGSNSALAGRVASQVIKAFVEKQRRVRNNPLLFSDKSDPGSVPVAALWSAPDQNEDGTDAASSPNGGTITVKLDRTKSSKPLNLPGLFPVVAIQTTSAAASGRSSAGKN